MVPASPFGRLVGLAVASALVASGCAIPRLDQERATPRPLSQTSFVYDRNGRLITKLHAEEDRIVIPPGRIPRVMKDAVVAIEDRRFWQHAGVDLKAMFRAARANVRSGEIVQGGSTITQQYVKNTITGAEQTVDRKMKEALLAYQLEQDMSKEQILGGYLNTVYFGQSAYGIQAAAREFFSKPARDLDLRESALLAGMISSPGTYDPIEEPEAARERRNEVLARMYELELIDREAYEQAVEAKLGLNPPPPRNRYPAAHFVEYVKRQVLSHPRFGETYTQRYNLLFRGGLRIHTTIDLGMQRAAERAVKGVLSERRDPYGALTAVDPRSGEIRAMVGGRNFFARARRDRFAKVNLATGGSTGRQAGSAFKPFALVAALENGISPQRVYRGGGSIAMDDPMCRNSPTDPWVVRNYEGSSFGDVTLEEATVRSINVVYAQVIRDVGPREVVDVARRMGIRSKLRPLCSSVLGTNEVTPLEMASAFGTLATLGSHVEATAITRIEGPDGDVLFESRPQQTNVLDPAVAYTTTRILGDAMSRGTGVAAGIGRPAAGKTGTAQQWRDAWFVGYVPQLVAAVWVGFPEGQVSMVQPRTRLRVTGGSFPAQIWHAFMRRATEGMPKRDFREPAGAFVEVPIDVTRGCVATDVTPPENVKVVKFVAGTQPTERCVIEKPVRVAVPSVIGMSRSVATSLLEGEGFGVAVRAEYEPNYAPGTVLSQSPAAGRRATAGTRVTITVSTPDPPLAQVPDVVGRSSSAASSRLEEAGFSVQVSLASKHNPNVKPGRVLSQTPSGGKKRPVGSTVTITVNPDG